VVIEVPKKAKNNRIVGKRNIIGFSELSDTFIDQDNLTHRATSLSEMSGGMSDDEMHKISRATINQKNKFHEEAVEKIQALLPTKDVPTAKAVKAIIYDEIKQTKQNLSGLDRAAELLKAVTKKKVEEVLKQKELIKKIIEHIENRNKERDASNDDHKAKGKKSDESSKKKKTLDRSKKLKSKENGSKLDAIEFESSESDSSYYDSTESNGIIESSPLPSKRTIKGSKNKKNINRNSGYFDF